MRVGVVLGAGGPLGWAFHLGVLEGIGEATGTQIGDADQVIGTSAGAAIGAATLTGRTADEILARATSGPDPELRAEFAELMKKARRPARFLRPQAPRLAIRPGLRDPAAAIIGLLPEGVFPTSPLRHFVDSDEVAWPPGLRIVTVGLADGKRRVLGPDNGISLRDALEASGTVPAMLQPKTIEGERYVDGAVHSATNTDLLNGHGHDLVVISSPMTRPGRGPVKIRARRHLAREVGSLRRSGARAVVVEPDEATMEVAAGFPRTNPSAGPAIVKAARSLTLAAFEREAARP